MSTGAATNAADLLASPTLTVCELAAVLRIGRNSAYALIREGKVRHLRVGSRILVPSSAVRALLEGESR